MHITCPVAELASTTPDLPALVGPARTMTYAELDAAIAATANRLGKLGVMPGALVALSLPASEGYVVLLFALWRHGCTACPLSTRLPEEGIASALKQIACTTLVRNGGTDGSSAHERIQVLAAQNLVRSGGMGDRVGEAVIDTDQPATILFTSGSSGRPRAALHSFGNHVFSALGSNANISVAPGDGWLLSLPLYHAGGLGILFRCLVAGGAVVMPPSGEALADSTSRLTVTHVSLVATQLYRLLHTERAERLAKLKAILLGGSAIPTSLLDEAVARGLPVHTSYGMTEMSSQVTTTPPQAGREQLNTSGALLEHRDLRISSEGEILVRGATLFQGYVEGDTLHRPVDEEGWFATRDLGKLDRDGNLIVLGRRDNLFISGGENIQPEAIERVLCERAGILEAVVVPVPDAEFGARPVAFVRPQGGALDPERYAAALRAVLPGFMVPRAFLELPQPEEGGGMKRDRAALARRAAAAPGGSDPA